MKILFIYYYPYYTLIKKGKLINKLKASYYI